MKEKITDKKAQWIGLILFGFVVFILHFKVGTDTLDDLWFREQLKEQSLLQYLAYRYENWTARILIEAVLVEVIVLPVIVWRVLDTLMILVIAYVFTRIILPEGKRKYSGLYALLLFFVPLETLNSAGYAATTINYVWPLALGMIAILPLVDIIQKKESALWIKIAGGIASVFAMNMEQIAALIAGISLVSFILYWKDEKKISIYPIVLFGIGTIEMVVAFMCPGNAVRIRTEVIAHFNDFPILSVCQKIQIGFLSEGAYYFGMIHYNYVLLVLIPILMACLWKKKHYVVMVLQVPGLLLIVLERCLGMLQGKGFECKLLILLQNVKPTWIGDYLRADILKELIVYFLLFGLLMLGIFFCGECMKERILLVLIMLAGMLSRFIMGFSPSVYVSGYRTAMYMTISFLLLAGILLNKVISKR